MNFSSLSTPRGIKPKILNRKLDWFIYLGLIISFFKKILDRLIFFINWSIYILLKQFSQISFISIDWVVSSIYHPYHIWFKFYFSFKFTSIVMSSGNVNMADMPNPLFIHPLNGRNLLLMPEKFEGLENWTWWRAMKISLCTRIGFLSKNNPTQA